MTLHLRSGLLLRAVALFVLAAAGCGADETGPDRTNLLLITIDTLRADALGAYDPQRTHSPRLDALAAEGVLFEQCLTSSPSTLPSHASILTGLHPYAHGVRSNQGYTLPPEARTLTEVLRAEGYVTAAEVATTVIERQKGLAQGFGRYRDVFSPGVTLKAALKRSGGETERLTFPERDAADITGHGIRFLREHRDTPFFLWLHYFDPHAPYLPPAEFAGRFPESPYHAEVAYADQQVGRVVDALQALGLADRTLLIVTSDHGEALGEHGEGTHSFFVYDSTMRVPLLFWGAGVPRGRRIGPLVRSVDIAPTALDLLGFPELLGVQGVSLRPLFSGEPRDPGLTGYGESIESFATFGTSVLRFVREGRWKYIHKVGPELYDVETVSGELRNRASAEPEVLARLRSRLEALVGETASPGAAAEIAVSETTLAELDALGYVGSRYRPSVGDELASLELGGVDPRDTVADAKRFSTAWTEYKDKRDYGRAAQLFADLMERYPESIPVLRGRIDSLLALGQREEAVRLMDRALELEPNDVDLRLTAGHELRAWGRPAEAEPHGRWLVAAQPCGIRGIAFLSNVLHDLGRFEEQREFLETKVAGCDHPALENELAYLLATYPDPNYRDGPRALKLASGIVRGDGAASPHFVDTLAAAYAEVGDFERATRAARRSVALLEQSGASQEVVDMYRAHLAAIEAGRPIRE